MLIKKHPNTRANSSSTVLLTLGCLLVCGGIQAQCAMCRASLESSGDITQAEAVNNGIIYLMIIPYVLVGLLSYAIYKMYQKKKKN